MMLFKGLRLPATRLMLLIAAVIGLALGLASPVLAQSGNGHQVGDRLAGADKGGKAGFREISWDDLIPADWNPEKFLADLELDDLQDNDPRAMELMQRMREEWDRAPVVERFSGQQVRIPGFVVPLESDGRTIREFLLVPYFGACVHVPPPPANQLIHVIPDQPIAAGLSMSPVWVNGVLNVGRVASELGSAGYQMRAMKVEAYTEPLPR